MRIPDRFAWIWKHRRFSRDVGALTGASAVSAALGFVQGILVARWLGPTGLGLAALIMTYPLFVFTTLDFRSGQAEVKFLGEFAATGRTDRLLTMCKFGYVLDLGIAGITIVIMLLTGRWIEANLLRLPGSYWLLLFYAAAFIPMALTGTSNAVFATLRRFELLALARIGLRLVEFVLVIVLLQLGWGIRGVIVASSMDLVARGLVLGVLAHRLSARAWGASWIRAPWTGLAGRWRDVLRFLVHTNLTTLLGVAVKQFDLLILAYFHGPAAAGEYRLAKAFASAANSVSGNLQTAIYPRFARQSGAGRQWEIAQLVRRSLVNVGLPLAGAMLLMLPVLAWAVPLLVGRTFLPAVPTVQILFAGSALSLLAFWVRPWFFATNRTRTWLLLGALNGVFALIAYPLGAAYWGAVGLAAARLGGGFVRSIPAVILAVRSSRTISRERDAGVIARDDPAVPGT